MILGLDLSLTCTGWARLNPDGTHTTGCIATNSQRPTGERLLRIVTEIFHGPAWSPDVTLAVGIESGVVRSNAALAIGMVHGAVRLELWRHDTIIVDIPPATRCKLATGKGNAGKAEVLAAAIHRLGYQGHSDDEADALWIADATARILGVCNRPVLPAAHLKALDKFSPKAA